MYKCGKCGNELKRIAIDWLYCIKCDLKYSADYIYTEMEKKGGV